jgi:poly(A) polymerase
MKYELYEVGGKIRDEFLGLKSKDVDYSVVILNRDSYPIEEVFEQFVEQIKSEGYNVFVTSPDYFTVRAKFPKDHLNSGLDADFVLARKELGYIKGTRNPKVVLGTLKDDLIRRDFTVNALAKDINGNIIDLFGGQKDLQDKILRTPSDAAVSFNDDPLRILRAMRFAITKKLDWSDELWRALDTFDSNKLKVVSLERKREELCKCFKFSTRDTMTFLKTISLYNYPLYLEILPEELWLEPTTKK